MATLEFDRWSDPPIILVKSPDTTVTIQELVTEIRDYEDEPGNMDIPRICDAAGKIPLGGGLFVSITMTLYDWKLKFEDRAGPAYDECFVTGGNLVGFDTVADDFASPIQPSAYTYVTRSASTDAALVNADAVETKVDALTAVVTFLNKLQTNKHRLHKVSDTKWEYTVYDDDGVTPIFTSDIEEEAITTDEVRTPT